MKILFYIHGITGGGGERVLSVLVNEFVKRNYSVSLATNLEIPFVYKIDNKVKLLNLYEGLQKKPSFLRPFFLRNNIRKHAKAERPDIIVAFMSALGCSVISSTLGLGIPVVVCEHTNVSRFISHSLNIKRRILYPFAKCITVLTRYDRKLWSRRVRNAVYMPNPVEIADPTDFINNRKKIILAVGRVNQWDIKGFDNLLRCWARICKNFPDWKLQIAGDTNENSKSYLIELANGLGACNYEFIGFISDIKNIMRQSEIFCLSSRVEGLPMVLIEAMNAGCCCVSFDVKTGPREIIVNNVSGLIAEDQNNDDLTKKLQMVMSNNDLRRKLASNAPKSIQKYSTERIIHRWNILFDKIQK